MFLHVKCVTESPANVRAHATLPGPLHCAGGETEAPQGGACEYLRDRGRVSWGVSAPTSRQTPDRTGPPSGRWPVAGLRTWQSWPAGGAAASETIIWWRWVRSRDQGAPRAEAGVPLQPARPPPPHRPIRRWLPLRRQGAGRPLTGSLSGADLRPRRGTACSRVRLPCPRGV